MSGASAPSSGPRGRRRRSRDVQLSRVYPLLGLAQKPLPTGEPARKRWIAKQKTAKDRLSRALRRLSEWCRRYRHDPLKTQHLMLVKKLKGHYGYYGITGNYPALAKVLYAARRIWRKALESRSQRRWPWAQMQRILKRFPLPNPRIVHKYGP